MNSSAHGDQRQPGFHPRARYEFKVHLDDSPYEQFTYRVTFGPGSGGPQAMRLTRLLGDAARQDEAIGDLVAEGQTGAIVDGEDGARIYAGEVADPFFFDLRLLHPMQDAVSRGTVAELGDWLAGPAENSFAHASTQAIVVELPANGPFPRHQLIGVWAAAKLGTDDGGWRQVNRAGIPMMWPIFSPDDTDYASELNEVHPAQDVAVDGKRIAELAAGIAGAYGTSDPEGFGELLAGQLLPAMLPYRIGTPASFSFIGFNGRQLSDNVVEVMYSLITNTAFSSRLSPRDAASSRQDQFPYVVPA